jgi:hypothetical protein
MAQAEEHLRSKHEAMSSTPSTTKKKRSVMNSATYKKDYMPLLYVIYP